MKKLLDSTFYSAQNYLNHAPDIISRLSTHKNKTRIRQAIQVCRDYLINHADPPVLKICAVKFLKDIFEEGLIYAIELIQQHILPIFKNVILFRQQIKTIKRGNNFFLSNLAHPLKGEEVVELMSKFIKPSKIYFQLVHQCVFFWAKYLEQEEKYKFKQLYQSTKHCAFPTSYQYFKQKGIAAFKLKYKAEKDAIEYELEDCIKKWNQTKNKMESMQKKDFVREKIQKIYTWITAFVTEYTNLVNDLKSSYYYKRKELQSKMAQILLEKKQFLKIYIECINRNSFQKLFQKYGKPEQVNEQFGIEKTKTIKKKKVEVEQDDQRLIQIKKIYLQNYPETPSKVDTTALAMVQRQKYYAQLKHSESNIQSPIKLPQISQKDQNKAHDRNSGLTIRNSNLPEDPPFQKLKMNFIPNGAGVDVSESGKSPKQSSFIILPVKSQSNDNRLSKDSTNSVKSRLINVDIRKNSLNNEVYRSELLKGEKRVHTSIAVVPSKWKMPLIDQIKNSEKGKKR